MKPYPWYVITGASCSGKTKLLSVLEEHGYAAVPEAARVYIDERIAKGETIEEIREDEPFFQKRVLEMKIATEGSLAKDTVTFFDRGIPDTWAYDELYGVKDNVLLEEVQQSCRYKKIFLLDRLPYTKDYARIETDEEQDRLHDLLKTAYERLGFPVECVPVIGDVRERADYVLAHL